MDKLLKELRPAITNYIKNFIESNTTPSKQIIIKKKYKTSKIGITFIGSEIENDPIIIYYVNPNNIGYKNGLRIGQHITKIGDTKVAGTGHDSVKKKLLSHKDLNITYKEGTESITYTETGDGIGKTDINEKDLITVKDDNDQEVVLLVKPEKRTQKDNQQNKFSACVIKNVEIKEQGKEKGKEEDSGFITKVELEEKLRNKENRANDNLFFTIIKDPNFTLFNHFYRMYTENNNKENLHVFFNYNAGANDTLGLGTDENLVITQVDAKKFGTSFEEGEKIKEVEGFGIFSIDAYKDKATELKKTPGIKYITLQLSKKVSKDLTRKVLAVNKDTARIISYYLYNVENNVFIHNKINSREIKKDSNDVIIDKNLNGIFIEAVEIIKKTQENTILNSNKMKYNEIKEILQKFRNMEDYQIKENDLVLAIAYTIDVEKAKTLYSKRSLTSRTVPFGNLIKNKLKRKFNSTFGLNSKNIAMEKASKLYETYIQFFILKNYEEEKEKINEFFKTNQLYKRLAKKFVLTQTAKYSYNENNIFSKDIEKIAELFHDVDIQDKIKKDIDKNVASDDEDINNKKMYNYIGFCNVLSDIVALKKSITNDEDYKKILQVKEDSIIKQLGNFNFNDDKTNKTFEEYKDYVVKKPIGKISDTEKMLQEIFDKSGLLKEYQDFVKEKKRGEGGDGEGEGGEGGEGEGEGGEGGEGEGGEGEEREKVNVHPAIKFFVNLFLNTEQLNELVKEEKAKKQGEGANKEGGEVKGEEGEGKKGGEEGEGEGEGEGKKGGEEGEGKSSKNQTGGELSFNKEKRSSSNRNFSLTEINSFIEYFKTITYDFKKLITDSIGDNKDKTINSFMNKYLNILIGEKIKDNLFETNDGVIEKYKKGIINPQFLTEKIGSIDSYNHLANTLMKTDDGIVKKVLDSLKSDKERTNSINIIKFELIKNDLMNMVIEHVTNINIVKDIVMEDNFVSKLQEKFQNKFNSKIGKTQREKEVSSETKQLLDSIFAPEFSDSKTIQNYKKQLREIDNIIENKAKTGSLDFVNVFTTINDKNIFTTSFALKTNGITINLGDDFDLKDAKEKQDNSEKEKILKLLTERAFSKSSIDIINNALNANAEKTNKVEEETLSRVTED